jgi:hypothetical protein
LVWPLTQRLYKRSSSRLAAGSGGVEPVRCIPATGRQHCYVA